MTSPIAILELRSVRGTGGGPEKTILLGASRSDRRHFAVTVCYIRDLRDRVFAIDHRAEHLRLDYVEVQERHSFDPRIWRRLTFLIASRRIDIVHSHDYKTDLLALLLARRTGVVPVCTAHGWTGQSFRERYLYYPIEKRLLTRFPRVIAVSTDVKDELVRRGVRPSDVTVMLNAIDSAAFKRVEGRRERVRADLGYRQDDVVIGGVGRLERQKRFDLLLTAFARLAPTHRFLCLAIAGDGSLRGELTTLADRLGLGDRCRFLGHQQDVAGLYEAFDVFVQSSDYEGTPNAVLEAMALETPIVATDVGGTQELATGGVHALIIARADVSRLQSALEDVLGNPGAARARAVAARRRVESELSFEIRTRRLEAIYEDLVRDRANVLPLSDASSPVHHA